MRRVQLLYEGVMAWRRFEYLDPLRQRFQLFVIVCTIAVSLAARLCQDIQQQGAVARCGRQIAIRFFKRLSQPQQTIVKTLRQLRIAEIEIEYKIPQVIRIDVSQFFIECIVVHRTK